jgi:hypothetical protein
VRVALRMASMLRRASDRRRRGGEAVSSVSAIRAKIPVKL